LRAEDIPFLQKLEDDTNLSYWGAENYRRFLDEFPEYFGCKAVVIKDAGRRDLVGFYLARSLFENLEILKVGVFPEYQRQGIGTQLMESAYAEGIRRGCRRCFLEVRKSNLSAIQFYYTHKFKIAGTRLNYYSDPVEDAWIMERDL
ncbi:MAG: ribosomal protein S18-alanine N-acetyltransferase, partial [Acidobacteriia bacterium]|nr:ribosomal protein S18-alanine N-acetyltransferase [Terriglobia bacterium]